MGNFAKVLRFGVNYTGVGEKGKFVALNKNRPLQFSVFNQGANGRIVHTNPVAKNIVKTVGESKFVAKFLPRAAGLAGVLSLAAGVGGYLLGTMMSDNDTENEQKAGTNLQVEPAPVQKTEPENDKKEVAPRKVSIAEEDEKMYHEINTSGLSWKGIVTTYYPGLVEKCHGQLYSSNGAIRILKNALSNGGKVSLVNETDIPQTLYLPTEIDGIKIKTDAQTKKEAIQQGGHTDIEEAGEKKTQKKYRAVNPETRDVYENTNREAVEDSLQSHGFLIEA